MNAGIVIVGGGQAAASAAAKIRALDADAKLTLVCGEPVLPYQRPPLSKKYLSGDMPLDRVILRPREWYDDNRIDLHLGGRAIGLDPKAQMLTLSDQTELAYEQALLATGSQARKLPDSAGGRLAGVHYLREALDADVIRPNLMPGARLVVVGGGYIGLEVAAIAAQLGLKVTILEAAERILQRVACSDTADFYRNLHRKNGVEVFENTALERFAESDGQVCGVILPDGAEIAADIVLVGIGVLPTTDLAEVGGLRVDNGIVVDARCRTSDARIFAAGDCTNFDFHGRRIRLESVPHAIHQAETAAQNMLGGSVDYVAEPWFWSDQYDVKLQIAGLNAGFDKTVTRPGKREGARSIWYFRADNLLAVDAMNDAPAFMMARKLLAKGVNVTPEQASDPAFDLRKLTA